MFIFTILLWFYNCIFTDVAVLKWLLILELWKNCEKSGSLKNRVSTLILRVISLFYYGISRICSFIKNNFLTLNREKTVKGPRNTKNQPSHILSANNFVKKFQQNLLCFIPTSKARKNVCK